MTNARHWRERLAWAAAGVLALGVALAYSGVIEGGPLDPPAPPGSTDSVRLPGTPISSLPFLASSSGHYYLTRDLVLPAGGTAISVSNDDVHIDLNGFALRATSGGTAVVIPGNRSRVTVRNGTVEGFTIGINQPGNAAVTQVTIEDLTIRNSGLGITVQEGAALRHISVYNGAGGGMIVGANSSIEDAVVYTAVAVGIETGTSSSIRNCNVQFVSGGAAGQAAVRVGAGSIIDQCTARSNAMSGIVGGANTTVTNSLSVFNGQGDGLGISLGQGSSVLDSVTRANSGNGIVVGNFSIVERSVAWGNDANGIVIGARSTVRASSIESSGLMGIAATNSAGAVIESNNISNNGTHGIEAGTGLRILNNTLAGNGRATAGTADGAGINLISTISHVEGNLLTGNDVGLISTSGNNTIIRNAADANPGGDYQFAADDLQGTTITTANDTTGTHSHYNYAP